MVDRELSGGRIQNTKADGVLLAARREALLDRVHLSGEDYIHPESFQRSLHPHWGILRRVGSAEAFLLTERRFSQTVDTYFWLLPSKLIEFYLRRSRTDQVRVLDAGGGRDGTTARDVASRFPSVQVINIDLVAINEKDGNFISQRGDLCKLDLTDRSIDIAYSHQVLPFMSSDDNLVRPLKVVREIYRVLKPGGVTLIDYSNDHSTAFFDVLRGEASINSLMLFRRKSYGGNFLLLFKDPVELEKVRLASNIPV